VTNFVYEQSPACHHPADPADAVPLVSSGTGLCLHPCWMAGGQKLGIGSAALLTGEGGL